MDMDKQSHRSSELLGLSAPPVSQSYKSRRGHSANEIQIVT